MPLERDDMTGQVSRAQRELSRVEARHHAERVQPKTVGLMNYEGKT